MSNVNIAIRCLNYLSKESRFSYVGLRLLLDKLAPDLQEEWLDAHLQRRVQTKFRGSFLKSKALRAVDTSASGPSITYRDHFVGTPTETLFQVWIMSKLANNPHLTANDSVFSYLWASPNAGHIFRPFMEGYRARNENVAAALAAIDGSVALVTDVKQFYPSVDREIVAKQFFDSITQSTMDDDAKSASELALHNLFEQTSSTGIPIGPPLSHLLGQINLRPVDEDSEKFFSNGYFRYVDDIIVVISKSGERAARKALDQSLERINLRRNEEKTFVVDRSTWINRFSGAEFLSAERFSFRVLIDRITFFLLRSPDQFEALKSAFRDSGFTLPLSRMRAQSAYGRFQRALFSAVTYFQLQLFSLPRHADVSIFNEFRNDSIATIITYAKGVRTGFLNAANALANTEPGEGILRRWHLQSCRFVFNRLIYLLAPETYSKFSNFIPNLPELYELRCTVNALASGDATEILRFPGAGSRTAGEIAREAGTKLTFSNMSVPEADTLVVRDSLAHLLLFGVLEAPRGSADAYAPHDSAILKFAAGNAPHSREFDDFSFADEVRSLQLGTNRQQIDAVLSSRFSDAEDISLDGLKLSGGGYYS